MSEGSAPLRIRICRVRRPDTAGLPELALPEYATEGSSGVDLRADLPGPLTLPPLGRALIPTGFALEIPPGVEGQVRPRSGLAVRNGITCLNSPGTVDADYRGELQVLLVNLSSEPFTLGRGDRIAQLVVARVERADWQLVDALSSTQRGGGGFGSTGR